MPTFGLAVPGLSGGGNRVTALRWARCLRRLGGRTFVAEGWDGRDCDVLVALHARKCLGAIERFRRERPGRPVVVAATGTDLYEDLPGGGERGAAALAGFRRADRIVVLQENAVRDLPRELRDRARVVHQSLATSGPRPPARPGVVEVAVLANLRAVKDPTTVAAATRRLPERSRVAVLHLGGALDEDLGRWAAAESRANPRWSWLGPRPRREALCTLARAALTVSASRAEGGANAVTEALALGVPVLASAIPGSTGLLGADHPGLFPPGDAAALAVLLLRFEEDPAFRDELARRGAERAWIADPARELAAWRALLAELGTPAAGAGP